MIKNIIILGVLSDPMIIDRHLLEVSKDVILPESVKRSLGRGNRVSVSSDEFRQILELNPNETPTLSIG